MGLVKDRTFYTYNDVTIMPGIISDIEHRNECNPFDENKHLPLFTAPMDTVVSSKNFELFEKNGIYAILPRTEKFSTRLHYSLTSRWAAFSLNEFEDVFCKEKDKSIVEYKGVPMKVLIDVANGHMVKIFDLAKKAKSIWGDELVLMGGNIANPKTYRYYAEAGFWGIRVSIGTGCGCLSSSNTSIHVPIVSLIDDMVNEKNSLSQLEDGWGNHLYDEDKLPKIIADGGIRNYCDIIKAIAIGADYVMVGSVFARMLESAAPKIMTRGITNNGKQIQLKFPYERYENITNDNGVWKGDYTNEFIEKMKGMGRTVEKENHVIGELEAVFYGMASKEGQIALYGSKVKTSEGLKKSLKVEYTMDGWCENFIDYLRSAMSYVGAKDLKLFRLKSNVIINSENAVKAVNK